MKQLPLYIVACRMEDVKAEAERDGDRIVSLGLCTDMDACPICGDERGLFDLAVVSGQQIKLNFKSCLRCKLGFDFLRTVSK